MELQKGDGQWDDMAGAASAEGGRGGARGTAVSTKSRIRSFKEIRRDGWWMINFRYIVAVRVLSQCCTGIAAESGVD